MRIISSVVPKLIRKRFNVKVSMTIFAQQAKVGSELSLVLGQYGVSVSKFCNDFNERSAFLSSEVPLVVDIFLFDNREFKFIIRGVNLVKLLRRFVAGRAKILRKEIFRVAFLYSVIMGRYFLNVYSPSLYLKRVCRLVLSILRSFGGVSVIC